jgi:MFS family permease
MPENLKKQTHPNVILSICCMSLLLIAMDVTIVNVALPSIEHELHASVAQLQWIIDAYTLVLASLLMLSGSMSDRFGRRRIFQIGLTMFSLGSLLCSIAPNIHTLILFRGLQGIGASMLNPVALSIIANAFTVPKERARAVGIWGAVAGASLALGPLIGGALVQTIGWRAIFWINLPISIAAILLTALFVPESKAPRARRPDPSVSSSSSASSVRSPTPSSIAPSLAGAHRTSSRSWAPHSRSFFSSFCTNTADSSHRQIRSSTCASSAASRSPPPRCWASAPSVASLASSSSTRFTCSRYAISQPSRPGSAHCHSLSR